MIQTLHRTAAFVATAFVLAATGAARAAPPEAPQLSLRLVAPERFSDAGHGRRQPGADELEALRQALEQALQPLVQRSLQPGDQLTLELLDVDLAGELQPTRTGRELRVLRGATWPRLQLRYSLLRGGSVQAQGEQQLSDLAYLDRRLAAADASRYAFEAALLRDWYQRTLQDARPPL